MFRITQKFLSHQQRIQRIKPVVVVRCLVENAQSSQSSNNTKAITSSSESNKIILPSTDGIDEWRTKQEQNTNSISSSLTSTADNDDTTPILSYQAKDMYDPEIHLPSAPLDWRGYEPNTPLTDEIIALIGVTGRPISTADFMRMALTHPEYGYYTRAVSKKGDDFDDAHHYDDDTTKQTTSALVIGADFVTAPEVSNVFGECLGVWFVTQWNQLQQPKNWQFLELGPGKGSLMVDLLRFTRLLSSKKRRNQPTNNNNDDPMFGDGCRRIHFIEKSPVLRQKQREDLIQNFRHDVYFVFDDDITDPTKKSTAIILPSKDDDNNTRMKKHTITVHWHDSFNAFLLWQNKRQSNNNNNQLLPTFVIGQEFLDALPIYAFEKTNEEVWRERLIDVALREDLKNETKQEDYEAESSRNEKVIDTTTRKSSSEMDTIARTTEGESNMPTKINERKKLRLRIVLAPEATPSLKTLLKTDGDGKLPNDTAPVGSVVEVCPEGILLVQDVAAMLEAQGGAALFIDYGSAQGSCDSLRGYSRHQQVHFLSRPGEVDITADVDFLALSHAINSRKGKSRPEMQQNTSSTSPKYASQAYGPTTQGEFLVAVGIQERVINLMESDSVSEKQAQDLYQAFIRLASPDEMGERYKVMAIATKLINDTSEDVPPGFS